jgi:uncharacterized membrane protein SirB2
MLVNELLSGAIITVTLSIALFFLRYWRQTRDSFFLCFALSFALMALERLIASIYELTSLDVPTLYLLRLLSYGLILIAIVRKNRRTNKAARTEERPAWK